MNVIFTTQIRKYFLTVNSQQTSMLSSLYPGSGGEGKRDKGEGGIWLGREMRGGEGKKSNKLNVTLNSSKNMQIT